MGKKILNNEYLKENIWQWKIVEYIAYLMIILVPLFFSKSQWYPFGMSKISIAIGGTCLMAIFYLWGTFLNKKFSFKLTPLHIVLGIFLVILTISSVLGVDPHKSFFGYFAFPTNLIFIYFMALFSFIVASLGIKSPNFLLNILLTSFLTSILVVLFSFTDASSIRIFRDHSSTIGNSSYAGAYLIFNVCFGVCLLFFYKNIWKKVFIAISTLFIITCPLFFNIGILFSKTGFKDVIHNPMLILGSANGATLGLFVSLFVIFSFFLIFSKRKIIKITGLIIFIIFSAGLFCGSLNFVNPDSNLHKVFVEVKGENRFIAWDIARKGFLERPLLGFGFDNFGYLYHREYRESEMGDNVEFLSKPHNIIWEYLSNNGILGLISFFVLLFFIFYSVFKFNDNEENEQFKILRITIIGILFGYFVQNLFIFDTVVTYFMFFLIIGMAMCLSLKYWNININNENLKNIFSFIFIVILIIMFIIFSYLPWKEATKWGNLFFNRNLSETKMTREGLQKISFFGGIEDSTDMANKKLNLYIENAYKINESNKAVFLDEIDSITRNLEKDILKQPNSYNSYVVLSSLLSFKMFLLGHLDNNIWDQSYNSLIKAEKLSPNDPRAYVVFSQLFVYKKDYNQARLFLKKALGIAPLNENSLKFAHKLQELNFNKDFEEYIKNIETSNIK